MAASLACRAPALRRRARQLASLLIAGTLAASCRSASNGPEVVPAGRPSARVSDAMLEREVLDELNRARANPERYAKYLESTLSQYDGLLLRRPSDPVPIRTREGVSAVREAIRVLRSTKPMPPFKLSTGMSYGARDHVRDAGPRGSLQHEGSDGSQSWHRVNRYGKWGGRISENMSFGPETGRDVVAALLIDDGVPSRGHRKNILDPEVKIVGVACGTHRTYRRMCDVVHAARFAEGPQRATASARQ